MFKDVYIDLEFKVVELEALYTAWRAGAKADMNKDVTANNIAYVTSDPVYAITRFFASNQAAPVGVNWSYYASPDVDKLIFEAGQRLKKLGKPAGFLTPNQDLARRVIDAGFVFVAVGSDSGLLVRSADALVKTFKG